MPVHIFLGLPMPCIAKRHTIMRAKSVPPLYGIRRRNRRAYPSRPWSWWKPSGVRWPNIGCLDAGYLFGPFGGLGRLSRLFRVYGPPHCRSDGRALLYIPCHSVLSEPDVSYGFGQCRVGAHAGAYPLVAVFDAGKIVEWVDVDELDSEVLSQWRLRRSRLPHNRGVGVGVVGPHDEGLHVLQRVLKQIERFGSAQAPVNIRRCAARPVEAFQLSGLSIMRNSQHVEETLESRHFISRSPSCDGSW